jgi:hypothetical protein
MVAEASHPSMLSNRSTARAGAARALALTIAGLAALLVVAAAPTGAQSQSDTVKIDPGQHTAVEIDFRDGPTKDISYEVTVQEGPNVDVLFLDNANYQKYADGESFEYVGEWSDLDTGDTDASFLLDRHGTWWLVLDHTDRPDDGASPATIGAEAVTARYSLTAETNVTDEARDRANDLPAPGASAAVGLLGAVALLAARER